MSRRCLWGGVTAVAIVLSNAALAADMPVKAPPASAYNWTGFYIGANGGYAWKDPTVRFTPNDPLSEAAFGGLLGTALSPIDFDVKGGFGGVQIGYNRQIGPTWVAGIEADFDFGDIGGSGASSNLARALTPSTPLKPLNRRIVRLPRPLRLPPPVPGTATASEDVRWFGTVRGRLGILLTDRFLVYGTGGLAYGRIEQNVDYATATPTAICPDGAPCFSGESSRTRFGWTAGAGVEWALTRNLTLKLEYLYLHLDGGNSFPVTAATPAGDTTSLTAQFSEVALHTARLGLNWRF